MDYFPMEKKIPSLEACSNHRDFSSGTKPGFPVPWWQIPLAASWNFLLELAVEEDSSHQYSSASITMIDSTIQSNSDRRHSQLC